MALSLEDKRAKIAQLRLKHQNLLQASDVFIPKAAYHYATLNEKIISFFDSDLRPEKDIYIEFVDLDYNSEDPNRRLYKWKFNPFYKEEYHKIENKEKGYHMYAVPVSELILIEDKATTIYAKDIPKEQLVEEKKILEEKPGYPDFNTQLRDSLAMSSMIGLIPYAGAFTDNRHDAQLAKRAFEIADAMILERNKKDKPKIKTV